MIDADDCPLGRVMDKISLAFLRSYSRSWNGLKEQNARQNRKYNFIFGRDGKE